MGVLLYPPYLQWEVCSECNHKCIHCYNYWRADNIPVEKCNHFEEITQKIIDRKPLYVAITGGEPLLIFDDIKKCIDRFIAAGIVVSISTNGTLITESIAEYLSKRHIDLVISLPSIDKKICDSVTQGHNVVEKLSVVWPILKKYNINTNINVVVSKLNISTLYETLKKIHELGFIARVGMAQRPINASQKYLEFQLDKQDFKSIVKTCIKAKHDFKMSLDFSVCMPDCAFSDATELTELEKGDCFGGTLAYSVCTNGDVKACQCDTMVYGNILTDSFEDIYNKMASWRDGSLIPEPCNNCRRLMQCRGGCRVESFANKNDYKGLPTFADPDNVPTTTDENEVLTDYSNVSFLLAENIKFLRDRDCYRVSVGIVPTYLSFEFGNWLKNHKIFNFKELLKDCDIEKNELNVIVNLLIKNDIIKPIN